MKPKQTRQQLLDRAKELLNEYGLDYMPIRFGCSRGNVAQIDFYDLTGPLKCLAPRLGLYGLRDVAPCELRINLGFCRLTTPEHFTRIILHEITHCKVGAEEDHGEKFRAVFLDLCKSHGMEEMFYRWQEEFDARTPEGILERDLFAAMY